MTLAEVVAKLRRENENSDTVGEGVLLAIRAFEADPEFTLPGRVRELAEYFRDTPLTGFNISNRAVVAQRLLALLEPKP